MVAAVLLLQLAAAGPPGLETARALLEAGDTVAATRILGAMAERWLAPEALAALALVDWIGRGATDEPLLRDRKRVREWHVRLWRDVRRGAVAFGDRANEAVGAAVHVQAALEVRRPDSLIAWDVDPRTQPGNWRGVLDSLATELDDESPLVAAGLRWLAVPPGRDRPPPGIMKTLHLNCRASAFSRRCIRLSCSPRHAGHHYDIGDDRMRSSPGLRERHTGTHALPSRGAWQILRVSSGPPAAATTQDRACPLTSHGADRPG